MFIRFYTTGEVVQLESKGMLEAELGLELHCVGGFFDGVQLTMLWWFFQLLHELMWQIYPIQAPTIFK